MFLINKTRQYSVMAIVLLGCLNHITFAEPSFTALTQQLKKYNQWNSVTAEATSTEKPNDIRPDMPYQHLKKQIKEASSADYPALLKWVETHKADVPAPLYLELAAKGKHFKAPQKEYLKWFAVSSLLSRYDLSQCAVTGANINATGLSLEYSYFQDEMQADITTAKEVMKDGVAYIKEFNYTASPMWACAHNKKTLTALEKATAEKKTETGILKSELVIKPEEIKLAWPAYVTGLSKMFNF